jgi:putative tricarboxylic transport membrane protein
MIDEPQIFWAVIVSMFIGNLVLLILNLPLIPYIAKVLLIPRNYLIPFILFFTLMGAYIGQNNATELLLLVGFGVCATALKFADYPLAPLLIGFILGGMLEDNFSRSMQLYDGIGFILERPMTLALLVIAMILVILPSYRARRAKARAEGVADGD